MELCCMELHDPHSLLSNLKGLALESVSSRWVFIALVIVGDLSLHFVSCTKLPGMIIYSTLFTLHVFTHG